MKTRVLASALLALASAGCSASPPGPVLSEGPASGGRSTRSLPNLFISPFGEPFRAEPSFPYPVAAWFAGADLDHDGRISREEFRQDGERFFRRLDLNHDGVIDGFEIAAYEQAIAPEILPHIEGLRSREGWTGGLERGDPRREADTGGRGAGGSLTRGAGLFSLLDEPEPVAAADADLDGRVTAAELRAAADRRFAALAQPGSDALTLATLPKTPVQAAREREHRR